ncbi:GatB/YqeY domain-containing protein [Candidatus Giovannonibacteria bacterium]|nr:GatB/YqeY domain-containing protein [Candidatus Giovannonibacteria bacterium]
MGNLKQKISDDIKEAMIKKEAVKLSTLRMLSASITNKEISLLKKDVGLSDEEVVEVLSTEANRRKDAIAEFTKGGRGDLADKEAEELEILKTYLPPEISDDELLRIIKDGIRETGAVSEKEFGKVMKIIMPALKGRASGDRISGKLREELGKAAK